MFEVHISDYRFQYRCDFEAMTHVWILSTNQVKLRYKTIHKFSICNIIILQMCWSVFVILAIHEVDVSNNSRASARRV